MIFCEEYIPTQWVDEAAPPINAVNLNHIENGIKHNNECVINIQEMLIASGAPIGGIIMFSGDPLMLPESWKLCDGTNGTPDLRNMFIRGAVDFDSIGETGGSEDTILPRHNHAMGHSHTGSTDTAGAHTHKTYHSMDAACGTCESTLSPNAPHGTWVSGDISEEGNHTHTITIEPDDTMETSHTGEEIEGSNLPPYYTLAYIMRIS